MAFDAKEFTAEVDKALDAMEGAEADEIVVEDEVKNGEAEGGEANEDKSEVAPVGDEDKVGGGAEEGESLEASEGDAGDDDGSADAEGDQEGSGDSEKELVHAKVAISDYAVEQAVRAGISIADARAFGSEEALLRVAEIARVSAAGVEGVGERNEKNEVEDILAGLPEFDPEEFQPEVVAAFDALKGVIRKQQESIAEINEQQSSADADRLASSAREIEVWFDREVEELGEDFAEVLGKGGFRSLKDGSSQLEKRDAIGEQMSIMLAGYDARGIQRPPRSEVFKTAVRSVLHDEFKQSSDKKVSDKLAKRSGQHMQRTSGKKAASRLSPEAETAELLDQKFPMG